MPVNRTVERLGALRQKLRVRTAAAALACHKRLPELILALASSDMFIAVLFALCLDVLKGSPELPA
ncbi:MAG: hypothetical protein JOZ62_11200 [Acidobacteriaceae bacterium]|nr:hypothetical protein [Acidobacteriaceae bacterium]